MELHGWLKNSRTVVFAWALGKKISLIWRYVLIIEARMRAGAEPVREWTTDSVYSVQADVYAYDDSNMDWAHLEMFQKYNDKPG